MTAQIRNPLVSIIMPVFNGSAYLEEAIESALSQTYHNIEILVVNDGSNDNEKTREIALSFGNQIQYFEKPNGGVGSALNVGIRMMKGDYFSWLSHDDVYYPYKLEKQINFLSTLRNPETILYSDFDIINEKSLVFSSIKIPHYPAEQFFFELLKWSFLHGCTLLIPRICFKKTGTFREDLKTTQDYDLWYRMSFRYDFVHQPEVLIKSRDHAEQGCKTMFHYEELDNLYATYIAFIDFKKYERIYQKPGKEYLNELYQIFNERGLVESRNKILLLNPHAKKNVILSLYRKAKYQLFLATDPVLKNMKQRRVK